jgi:hypothetical protein
MSGSNGKSAAERYEACRVIDEACGREMEACLDMIEAAGAIGARAELHAVRDALQRLHVAATAAFEEASRTVQN